MPSRPLILCDASTPALVACAIASEELAPLAPDAADAGRPFVLPFRLDGPMSARHDQAIARAAQHFGLTLCSEKQRPSSASASSASEGEREVVALLSAAYLAATLGCTRVVWPVQAVADGPMSLDRVAQIIDRCRVVSRLATLDADALGGECVCVEAPFADLRDEQIADLAVELSVPPELCWWWGAEGAVVTRAGAKVSTRTLATSQLARWTEALMHAGWRPDGAPARAGVAQARE